MLFSNPDTAAISLQFHAIRCWEHRDTVHEVFRTCDWTCGTCGTALPHFMEIDHCDDDHENWCPANLRPICHFCHLAKHPAQPGIGHFDLLRPILLPEMSQAEISALGWAVIWGDICPTLKRFTDGERPGWKLQTAFVQDKKIGGELSVHGGLKTFLRDRINAAQDYIGAADLDHDLPLAMLCVSHHLGKEGDFWKHLRWWPTGTGVTNHKKEGPQIIRWIPGEGLSVVGTKCCRWLRCWPVT